MSLVQQSILRVQSVEPHPDTLQRGCQGCPVLSSLGAVCEGLERLDAQHVVLDGRLPHLQAAAFLCEAVRSHASGPIYRCWCEEDAGN